MSLQCTSPNFDSLRSSIYRFKSCKERTTEDNWKMSSIVNASYRFLKCQDQEGGSRRIFGSLLFRSRRLLRIFVYLMYVVYNCGGRRIPIIFKNAKWKCLASSEDQRKHGTPQGVCQMVVVAVFVPRKKRQQRSAIFNLPHHKQLWTSC